MKVQYADFDVNVDDATDPVTIFNTLKQTYQELSNGDYSIGTVNGEKVMKVYVKTGNKA